MTKPVGAKQVAIDCDLTGFALTRAYDLVVDELEAIDPRGITEADNKPQITVKVASQNLPQAITLSYLLSCQVEIDFSYDVDEWSIHAVRYKFEAGMPYTIFEAIVWSPGA